MCAFYDGDIQIKIVKMAESYEEKFKVELYKKYELIKKIYIPKDEYYAKIDYVKTLIAKTAGKDRDDYYLLKKYEIMQCGDVQKLIRRRADPGEEPIYFVSIEDTYDIIKRAHVATGHGGRDRMLKEINKKYANVTREAIELYKSYCQECQKKRKRPRTKGVVVRPILTKEFASRGQVDLIDMQSMAQQSFKWIMVYQDHLTKFVILRALTSKRASEVAHHLLDIFLLIGAPSILQSDNGSEFTAEIISELKIVWPRLVMVHGKPRHPQSQGSVERANGDIKDMLVAWMGDYNTNDWSMGIKFVQFQKNSSLHFGINRSPYAAMFGCEVKVGLTSSSLPNEVIERMQTEDDLLSAITNHRSTDAEQSALSTSAAIEEYVSVNDDAVPSTSQDINFTERATEVFVSVNHNAVPSTSHDLDAAEVNNDSADPSTSQDINTTEVAVSVNDSAVPSTSQDINTTEVAVSVNDDAVPSTSQDINTTEVAVSVNDSAVPSTSQDMVYSDSNVSDTDMPVLTPIKQEPQEYTDLISQRIKRISAERQGARSAQLSQAERMVKRSRVELVSGKPGDNVAVPIPLVDRGRGDPRNILGVIIDRDEHDMYKIAVKSGLLKTKFSRNQFDICPQRLLSETDVSCIEKISLRQAVSKESSSGGQGFVRCNCAGKKRCQTNRCKCFKSKIKCSSRCHSCLACTNK